MIWTTSSNLTDLLLVLKYIHQGADVWQDLNTKFLAVLQGVLWVAREPNACGRARDDDCAGRQRGRLRQEGDQLWNVEDEIVGPGRLQFFSFISETPHVKFRRVRDKSW